MKDAAQQKDKISPVTLKIPLDRDFFPEEIQIVTIINEKYSNKEIFLTLDGNTLNVYLYKLDPDRFFSIIKEKIQNSSLLNYYQNGTENPFDLLEKKILAIGSYGIRYGKRVFVGYANERKVQRRKEKESERGSYFYAHDNPFKEENNTIPKSFINQIICGDSEDILIKLPENCIDLIITSPPYNFGLEYSSSGDSKHWEAYLDKLFRVFSEGIRVLKFGGRIIVNIQPLFSDYIPLHHLISHFFMTQKMIWKGEILWEKNNYNCKYTSWGSWKSPSSPYLKYTWEFLEIFCKGSLKKTGKSENADINDEEFKSWVVAKWAIGPERRMKQYNHPAMFPEELVERCLKLFSFKGDIILDPFNGAGTSTAVASRIGRQYLGIDLSSEYCDIANERLKSNNIVKKKEKSTNPDIMSDFGKKNQQKKVLLEQQTEEEESTQHHLDHYFSADS